MQDRPPAMAQCSRWRSRKNFKIWLKCLDTATYGISKSASLSRNTCTSGFTQNRLSLRKLHRPVEFGFSATFNFSLYIVYFRLLWINLSIYFSHKQYISAKVRPTQYSTYVCGATSSTQGADVQLVGYRAHRTIKTKSNTRQKIQKYQKTQRTQKHVTNQEHLQFILELR